MGDKQTCAEPEEVKCVRAGKQVKHGPTEPRQDIADVC